MKKQQAIQGEYINHTAWIPLLSSLEDQFELAKALKEAINEIIQVCSGY